MKNLIFSSFLLLSFVFSVSAQKAQKADAATQNLRHDVEYLASDALAGRRTGETGATNAAGYVANKFADLKLKAGVSQTKNGRTSRNYLQEFPFVTASTLGENNFLEFKSETTGEKVRLKLIDEWMPLGFSASDSLENLPLVDVGYGISAKNLNYDDYRGVDLKNCVAVAIDAVPDRKFDDYADLRRKALAAREAGAKALIILADISQEKYKKLNYDNLGDAGLPVIVVSGQGFTKTNPLRLPKTGAGARSADGTEYSGNVTTKPDGTRIVAKSDGTTFTYKIQERKEGNSVYSKRVDTKTLVKNPDGTSLELENDYLFHDRDGEKEEDFTVSISTELLRQTSEAYNVIGVLEGNDTQLKTEAIVIGAHYDHLGRGGQGSLAVNSTAIHHGADDNASGVAAMLELARTFTKSKTNKRTLIFIAFGGEEEGLLGSKFYVNNPIFPLAKTVAMINMDMVGRLKDDKLTIGGIGTASEWKRSVEYRNFNFSGVPNTTNSVNPVPTNLPAPKIPMEAQATMTTATSSIKTPSFNLQLNEDGFGPSDHSSFYGKQIPVLFFFTGSHEDYHKPTDTADKINYDGLLKIENFVGEIVRAIDANPNKPTYTVAKSSGTGEGRRGFNISLGTVPSYADGTNDGLLLDGVRDDSPAAKSGIKAGDKIVKLAGHDVRNISDYVFILGEMKAGTEYEIVVVRGAENLALKIIPAARK